MSADDHIVTRLDAWRRRRHARRADRPRVRKLRLLLVLGGMCLLALVSTVFGMMMAVASDLPRLEDKRVFQIRDKQNSILYDRYGRKIGILTGNQNVILARYDDIAPSMREAVVAIEDKRFYTNGGVDIRGIGRAFVQDIVHKGAVQGASTITQQFVKNQLAAQNHRTVFQKLREAALAYHLTRKWSKAKILTEYLNSVYFGHGAYGIESAARVYFAKRHPGCAVPGRYCANELGTVEAASLAGMIASPSAYDPLAHPRAFSERRDLVLRKMLEQRTIDRRTYAAGTQESPPTQDDLTPPAEKTAAPYFTSWLRPLIEERLGQRAYYGDLRIQTSLDLDLQKAAESAVSSYLSAPGLPSAAVVVLDNKTGQVRAMVGGSDYANAPFNLATQGQRQPGSAFKPYTLAVALQRGYGPGSILASQKKVFTVPNSRGKEKFVVNNYEGAYTGSNTLAGAMAESDNSIYAELGIRVGTKRVARMARGLGIRTPVSTNYAMTLGGLKEGVTPLDMAHAYSTFAAGGQRVSSSNFGASEAGPVGIASVTDPKGHVEKEKVTRRRVLPAPVAQEVSTILTGVIQSGTGRAAAVPGFAAGKTGTTENYGDAWFVGYNERYTIAVWVGYPNALKSMKTAFHGSPVAGGTYPALIWHAVMTAALGLDAQRDPKHVTPSPTTPVTTAPTTAPTTTSTAPPTTTTTSTTTTPAPTSSTPAPAPTPTPQPAPTPKPTPAPTPPPTGGGGGAGGGGTGGTGGGPKG